MEAFSPQTDHFVPLEIRIPEAMTCLLIVHNNLLVVRSEHFISKYEAVQEGQLVLHSERQCCGDPTNPSSQPVVDGNHCFFCNSTHMVYMVDLENGRAVQRFG